MRKRDTVGEKNPNWKGGVAKIHVRYTNRFRLRHPQKHAAQVAVASAIRAGLMARPYACSECGCRCKPDGHHDDYTKPLIVRWLCKTCHVAADRDRQAREAA